MTTRRGEAGFTLTELMVVVVIVGVIASVAIVRLRPKASVRDVAQRMSDLLRKASRHAVAGGAIRSNVSTATGVTARARTRMTSQDGVQYVMVERFVEDPEPATGGGWEILEWVSIPSSVQVYGVRASAETQPGLGPETVITTGEHTVQCYANGSCDAVTIYVQSPDGRNKARTVVMPLHGAPLYFAGW